MDNNIWVETMVSSRTNEPKVTLRWYDHSGELTPAEARAHAMNILAAAEAAESDAVMVGFAASIGMDRNQQAALLHAFRQYRDTKEEESHAPDTRP